MENSELVIALRAGVKIGDMSLKAESPVLAAFDHEGKAVVWTGSRLTDELADAAVIESPDWVDAAAKAIPYFKSFTMSFADVRVVLLSSLLPKT
jgi:hypothetical protein